MGSDEDKDLSSVGSDQKLVGSDQDKYLRLWGNSEKKRLFLGLEWQFGGRNCPDKAVLWGAQRKVATPDWPARCAGERTI